jgi:hypothetical protein
MSSSETHQFQAASNSPRCAYGRAWRFNAASEVSARGNLYRFVLGLLKRISAFKEIGYFDIGHYADGSRWHKPLRVR